MVHYGILCIIMLYGRTTHAPSLLGISDAEEGRVWGGGAEQIRIEESFEKGRNLGRKRGWSDYFHQILL